MEEVTERYPEELERSQQPLDNPVRVKLTDYQLREVEFRMEVDADDAHVDWGQIEHTGRTTRYLVLETVHDLDRAVWGITSCRDIELDNASGWDRQKHQARANSLQGLLDKILEQVGGPEAVSPDMRRWLRY